MVPCNYFPFYFREILLYLYDYSVKNQGKCRLYNDEKIPTEKRTYLKQGNCSSPHFCFKQSIDCQINKNKKCYVPANNTIIRV